jgi:hypothetical protein
VSTRVRYFEPELERTGGAILQGIPEKISDLTNDLGFVDAAGAAAAAPVQSVNGNTGAVTVTVPTNVSELTNDSGYIKMPTVSYANGSAVNVASGTATTVQTITLSAGVWAVQFDAQFASNATGYRGIHLATSSGGGTMDRHSIVQVPAVNGATTRLTFTTFFSLSAETTYYLVAEQDSGSTLSVTPGYRYMKFS